MVFSGRYNQRLSFQWILLPFPIYSSGAEQWNWQRGLKFLNAFNGMLCILISENVSRSLILNNMRAKVEFGTPEKARVKFPHSLILHFAFSSWIEKIMTKTRHCHWENRFVLAVRKFYQGEFSRSSVGQFWCILLYVWGSSERVCLQICHCIGYGKSVMSPQHGVKLI